MVDWIAKWGITIEGQKIRIITRMKCAKKVDWKPGVGGV